jgi:ABC-type nitrate/sulfonate/bicarbonate transport system permease component
MDRLSDALRNTLPPLLLIASLALLLEGYVGAGAAPSTVAAPSLVLRTIWIGRDDIWRAVEPTLLTASTGFILATVVALLLGLFVYVFRRVETGVLAMAAVLTSIPMIALAPALITLMGMGLGARIAITTIICAFPMIVAAVQGLSCGAATELFTVLAASPWQKFRLLALPTALPYLFLGAKIAAPLALLGSLIAEWTGAEDGLGVYMLTAMFGLHIAQLWASVAITCLLSMAAYGLVAAAERLAVYGPTATEGGA